MSQKNLNSLLMREGKNSWISKPRFKKLNDLSHRPQPFSLPVIVYVMQHIPYKLEPIWWSVIIIAMLVYQQCPLISFSSLSYVNALRIIGSFPIVIRYFPSFKAALVLDSLKLQPVYRRRNPECSLQTLLKEFVEVQGIELIDAINGKCKIPWRIRSVINDIKNLATQFDSISFQHIWREANFSADALAHIGHNVEVESWSSNFPEVVLKAICFYIFWYRLY